MKKYIDWDGFKDNVETYLNEHEHISGKMLKTLFDNYSEDVLKNTDTKIDVVIPIYDESNMAVFADGYYYNISKGEFYNIDDKLDKTRKIPKKELIKFSNIVKSLDSKLSLVRSDNFDYYFVAYLGIADDDFEWNDEFNKLSKKLDNTLKENGIGFD